MSAWQPIETAPKGEVLLYFPRVFNERRREVTHNPMIKVGWANTFPHRPPTHWMPLPEAPQ